MWKWIKKLFKKKPTKVQDERPNPGYKTPIVYNDNPLGLKFLYPEAVQDITIGKLSTFKTHKKLPPIMIIHHTAGHQDQSGHDYLVWLKNKGLCTWVMDQEGRIFQNHDGNKVGWHIGSSVKMNGKRIYKDATGIEMAAGGKLQKRSDGNYYAWFNRKIPKSQVRVVTTKQGYMEAGAYQKYTKQQEKSLAKFLKWAITNGVEITWGHDEIDPSRKNDPGGSLSMPLGEWLSTYVY